MRMYCETHVYTSEKTSTTASIIILLLEMVTIPIQTCIPTADLDYGEDISHNKESILLTTIIMIMGRIYEQSSTDCILHVVKQTMLTTMIWPCL